MNSYTDIPYDYFGNIGVPITFLDKYNPEQFDLKQNSLEQIVNTMTKSELDHWINEAISISTMFFGIIWGETWIFVLTAIAAMIFDSQFIIIQRYNRPRVVKILEGKKQREEVKV